MQRFPVALDATFVGTKEASEFVRNGERIAIPAKPQFLTFDEDGQATVLTLSGSQLDKIVPAFNYADLTRGQQVRVEGVVVLQDRGSDRDSYFTCTAIRTDGGQTDLVNEIGKENGKRTPAKA